ncbi:MAG: hypothetical protein HY898_33120 [Deltaproteobacteria bacterium]|nr:hypothetical protein [Deltaproteobacteria bacterium]
MEREREKKSWRDVDRGRDRSHPPRDSRDSDRRRDEIAKSAAETREVRSALEALFAPRVEETAAPPEVAKIAPRMVLPPSPNADPRNAERRRLLGKLLAASGPGTISKIADEFLSAGFALPDDQEVHLQLLEHVSETRVREAVEVLSRLLAGELPKRKHVLDQRLRRIEEHAEEETTKTAASALRKLIHGRPTTPQPGRVR